MKRSVFAYFVLICANLNRYGVTARKPKMTPSVEELLIQEGDELRLSCQGEGRLQFSAEKHLPPNVEQSNFTGSFDEASNTYTFIRAEAIRGDTGWYACAEEKVLIVNDEQTIDHPREEISWIYVFVNSSRRFIAEGDEYIDVYSWIGKRTVIPCRTTSPNLPVTLLFNQGDTWQLEKAHYDPRIGFIANDVRNKRGSHYYQCAINGTGEMNAYLSPKYRLSFTEKNLQKPIIKRDPIGHVVWGQDLTLDCSVEVPKGTKFLLNWTIPNSVPRERLHYLESPKQLFPDNFERRLLDTWKAELTIKNVSKTDGGEYICVVMDGNGNRSESSVEIEFWDPSYTYINTSLTAWSDTPIYEETFVHWEIRIETYPQINELNWYKPDGIQINKIKNNLKYIYRQYGEYHYFHISKLVVEDSGNYTIHVSTSHNETSIILPLTVLKSKPEVIIKDTASYFAPSQSAEVVCVTYSKYLSNVTWNYKEYPDFPSKENIVYKSPSASTDRYDCPIPEEINIPREEMDKPSYHLGYLYMLTSRLNITINMTGDLVCSSCNANGCAETTKQISVSDVAGRFGVVGPGTVTEGDVVHMTCGASVYYFTDEMFWTRPGITILVDHQAVQMTKKQTKFTFQLVFRIRSVKLSDDGTYECHATDVSGTRNTVKHTLIVKEALPPQFTGPDKNNSEMLVELSTEKTKTVLLVCFANGRPIPTVTWRKNDQLLIESGRYKLSQNNSVLEIKNFSESDSGRYICYATNRIGKVQRYTDVKIAEAETHVAIWPIVSVVIISSIIVVAWMTYRKRREMAARRRFIEATLQRFNAGALDCLDPELNMAEQAELLPYNKKWEFPRELLKLGKELGSGAFGVVRMAEAKSICQSEAVTTVAVKVVRSTANLNHMTALQRELKILAYLGKHLNVVNLLGACTKHVSFGQLLVIVEFCRFGNLRDYLVRRRTDFVNQAVNVGEDIDASSSNSEDLDTANDNGLGRVSCDMRSASAAFHRSTNSTDRSTAVDDHVPEPDPLQQARRINYQGEYADENLEPISTRDLLCWAWQVARGMKFLGLRRILHGDLAARNILLADHNVVKICDFGLAKALLTDDNYQQKGNDPLPFKWMAIESLKDRIFSVHSDVWSYGVVLWEFYSLAKTPYSGIRAETLCEKLAEGFRMGRPEHATSEIYQIMLHCWNAEPFQRPSFAKLVEDVGHLLEDSVKTHYFDLNASYYRMTADASRDEEPDYLTMSTSEVRRNPNEQTPV